VQATVLTVTDRNIPHGEKVLKTLVDAEIRAKADFRNEKLGLKIREAQVNKTPYMLIVGDKECEKDGLTARLRSGQNLPLMTSKEFIDLVREECKLRR
jgi:threonyl-tRNA synthetase